MSYETTHSSAPYAILVALTFDETGVNALREAARIAELHPASQLHVVHVVAAISARSSSRRLETAERRLERAPDVMRRYVEHVWSNVPRKVIGHLRVGVPSRAILQTAVDVNAELVVVGTHRRSGVKKLMLGSVAEQVVRHAHCPVFIAMPKDYSGKLAHTDAPEPVCTHCLAVRARSGGEQLWCKLHGHPQSRAQVYQAAPSMPPAVPSQVAAPAVVASSRPERASRPERPSVPAQSAPARAAAAPRQALPARSAPAQRPALPAAAPASGPASGVRTTAAAVPPPISRASQYRQAARARSPR